MENSNKDYIPRSNAKFNPWQINFTAKVDLFKSGWNWPPSVVNEWKALTDPADSKKQTYDKAWAKVSTGVFDSADEQRLKDARKSYESGDKQNPDDISIRIFINRNIRFNPLVTNDQKIDMKLIVPDEVKTPSPGPEQNIDSLILVGSVKSISKLSHTSAVNRPGAKSKAKGEGVDEIEVFIAFTDADATEAPAMKDFQYDGEVKRGLYKRIFDVLQEGKRAWYYARLRFKGKKITFGPPSDFWDSIIP